MNSLATHPVTYGRDASIARFSVARYERMIEAGILTSQDCVELLENYVVLKMSKNPAHDGTIDLGKAALGPIVPAGWLLRVQQTIALTDSQPEPDFSIVRGNPRSFLLKHPAPPEIGLVVEVADSSLLRDQRDKTRIYARAGIPCYWIINLVDARIEVYTQPSGPIPLPLYGCFQTFQPTDMLPLVLSGNVAGNIAATDLLP